MYHAMSKGIKDSTVKCKNTRIKAWLFKRPFYKGSHSKGIKGRALHVHQRKTKHFIAKLLAQPYRLLHTFSILVVTVMFGEDTLLQNSWPKRSLVTCKVFFRL